MPKDPAMQLCLYECVYVNILQGVGFMVLLKTPGVNPLMLLALAYDYK